MKLSVIVTTYNVEKYVTDCLLSILSQLSADCQLIVVDDASTDKTVQKIKALTEPYGSKVVFFPFKENHGVSVARNKGLELADGDYIAFLDGDDMVSSVYVRNILIALNSKKDIYYLGWKGMFGLTKYDAKHLPEWNCSVWSRVFKKNFITRPFQAGLNWGEDWQFLHDNIKKEVSHGFVPEYLYFYRENREGSLTQIHK